MVLIVVVGVAACPTPPPTAAAATAAIATGRGMDSGKASGRLFGCCFYYGLGLFAQLLNLEL
jgi:hypothetical protein